VNDETTTGVSTAAFTLFFVIELHKIRVSPCRKLRAVKMFIGTVFHNPRIYCYSNGIRHRKQIIRKRLVDLLNRDHQVGIASGLIRHDFYHYNSRTWFLVQHRFKCKRAPITHKYILPMCACESSCRPQAQRKKQIYIIHIIKRLHDYSLVLRMVFSLFAWGQHNKNVIISVVFTFGECFVCLKCAFVHARDTIKRQAVGI
jgi:hypothetical protein